MPAGRVRRGNCWAPLPRLRRSIFFSDASSSFSSSLIRALSLRSSSRKVSRSLRHSEISFYCSSSTLPLRDFSSSYLSSSVCSYLRTLSLSMLSPIDELVPRILFNSRCSSSSSRSLLRIFVLSACTSCSLSERKLSNYDSASCASRNSD